MIKKNKMCYPSNILFNYTSKKQSLYSLPSLFYFIKYSHKMIIIVFYERHKNRNSIAFRVIQTGQ